MNDGAEFCELNAHGHVLCKYKTYSHGVSVSQTFDELRHNVSAICNLSQVETQKTPEFLTNKKHYYVFISNPAMFRSSMKMWPTATAHHSYFGSQFRSAALHHSDPSDPSDHCELSFSQAFLKATGANLAAADTLQPK